MTDDLEIGDLIRYNNYIWSIVMINRIGVDVVNIKKGIRFSLSHDVAILNRLSKIETVLTEEYGE